VFEPDEAVSIIIVKSQGNKKTICNCNNLGVKLIGIRINFDLDCYYNYIILLNKIMCVFLEFFFANPSGEYLSSVGNPRLSV